MNITAYVLVMYMGGQAGYITVPDIRTEEACIRLAESMTTFYQRTSVWTQTGPHSYKCFAYEKTDIAK